jgi:hypothetical protein
MTNNFKGIFLDKERIDDVLRSGLAGVAVLGPTTKEKFVEYKVEAVGQQPATLQIFHKVDGTTTLHYKVGANQHLSYKAAEVIAAGCLRTEYEPRPLVLAKLGVEDFRFLIEHLKHDWKFEVGEEPLEHGQRFRVKKGIGDEVVLHLYNTGKFLMQGKAREVYGIVAQILCEVTPDKKQVVDAQLKSFHVEGVTSTDLLEELRQWIPSAMGLLGDAGAAIIAPSLALAKLAVQLPDYSAFAFPALKGLEAYMKVIMARHGYSVRNTVGFGDYLVDGGTLKPSVRQKMDCPHTVAAVEKSYNLYHKHRHSLFHVEANVEMSRILDDKAAAVGIIHEVLNNIEKTASAMSP